MRRPLYLRTI